MLHLFSGFHPKYVSEESAASIFRFKTEYLGNIFFQNVDTPLHGVNNSELSTILTITTVRTAELKVQVKVKTSLLQAVEALRVARG
jgi:hypothetical protein